MANNGCIGRRGCFSYAAIDRSRAFAVYSFANSSYREQVCIWYLCCQRISPSKDLTGYADTFVAIFAGGRDRYSSIADHTVCNASSVFVVSYVPAGRIGTSYGTSRTRNWSSDHSGSNGYLGLRTAQVDKRVNETLSRQSNGLGDLKANSHTLHS